MDNILCHPVMGKYKLIQWDVSPCTQPLPAIHVPERTWYLIKDKINQCKWEGGRKARRAEGRVQGVASNQDLRSRLKIPGQAGSYLMPLIS